MPSTLPRPPYDIELGAALAKIPLPHTLTEDLIKVMRGAGSNPDPGSFNENFKHEEITIPGPAGDIVLSIWRKQSSTQASTSKIKSKSIGLYHIHGGGMVMGTRFSGVPEMLAYLQDFDAVCVSVEYRLAPENQDPIPVEDCYTGLQWMAEHADQLGIDASKIFIAGSSAGGGLAAGVTLLARDRGGPVLSAQMLLCPMLDDRNETLSSRQYVEEGTWSRGSNELAWKCLLGDRAGTENVSIYASPGRASDMTALPTAYIDLGAAEVFRDEGVAYASCLWAAGVQAELHVWPGAFHAFDLLAPTAAVSVEARKARGAWMRRLLTKLG